MKKRKLKALSSLILLVASYFIFSSYGAGITGQSINGCSCHGSSNSATLITFTGIPAGPNGWVPGTVYPVTLTITNTSKLAAGFDMTVDKGSFSSAPSGTAITASNLEIRHLTPASITSGSVSWTFNWTAPTNPTSTLVIFKVAGNAVNLNGQTSFDQWNTATFSYIQQTAPSNPPSIALTSIASITSSSAIINGVCNANGANTGVSIEYGLTTAYGSLQAATPPIVMGNTSTNVATTLTGLSPATLYHLRYKASNTGGVVYTVDTTFTTLGLPISAPTIVMGSPTSITTTGATINASVNANNGNTAVSVQYGLTTAYGSTLVSTPANVAGNTLIPTTAQLTALLPNTLYHYRVVATNNAGTTNSVDSTFTTSSNILLPTINLNPITNLTSTSATVNASVNANNANTTIQVQYGLTTAYGSAINTIPASVSGSNFTSVLANISGLLPNTTYQYRVSATNSVGTVNSSNATFTTGPSSINSLTELNIKIYPNPAYDKLYIESENGHSSSKFVAFSMLGSRFSLIASMINNSTYSLDIASLPVANYILLIERDSKLMSFQFQKK